jgi:hypothetical protein
MADVHVLPGVQADRDAATGLPIFFKAVDVAGPAVH